MSKYLILMLLIFCLVGCATIQATAVPGETTASLTLKGDILRMINMIEKAQAPGCAHKIVDTKFVSIQGNTVNEEWIIESCGKNISYPVSLTPDPNGGTYFGVKTPDKGVR